jgi:hypothetical protein
MPKFPGPPGLDELLALRPDLVAIPAGSWLWRIYFREPPGRSGWNVFRAFGPVERSRFDHHLPPPRIQGRKIMYASLDPLTCLAEVFQHERRVHRGLKNPWLVGFAIERDVRLLSLAGTWPTAAGASMAINSGPRDRAREWSRAIYDAYPTIDGLWYGSSMNANRPSIALYERADDAIPTSPIFNRPLSDPALATTLRLAADQFGYDLV